jgi:hypothetical protein
VATVQVIGAVRRRHRHGRREAPGEQEAQQVTGRLVRPVHVLDDDEQRRVLGELVQRRVDRLEQLGPLDPLVPVGTGQQPAARLQPDQRGVLGDQPLGKGRGVGGEPAQQLAERQVGQGAVAEVQAVADQAAPAGRGRTVHQLREHPGLADPGIARDQRHSGLHARGEAERGGQLGQLALAPPDREAGGAAAAGFCGEVGAHESIVARRRGVQATRIVVGPVTRPVEVAGEVTAAVAAEVAAEVTVVARADAGRGSRSGRRRRTQCPGRRAGHRRPISRAASLGNAAATFCWW